jgi:hypothetical protein
LEIQIKLNATTITQGEEVLAQISLFNPLPYNYTFALSYNPKSTVERWNWYDFICPTAAFSSWVWSYALFKGHWSVENISAAGDPLTLWPPVQIACPSSFFVYLVTFLPRNSTALVYYSGLYPTYGGYPVGFRMDATTEYCRNNQCGGIGSTLFGFWNITNLPSTAWENFTTGFHNATISSPYFHLFPPGQYTLVAEDVLGQATYAYFQVVPR